MVTLVNVGVSHKNTPEALREKVAFIQREKLEIMAALKEEESILESLVLSTCNRSEIYAVTEDIESTKKLLIEIYRNRSPELLTYLNVKTGEEALTHLFRVACGLDSMVIGEDQIVGQVREALTFSRENGFAGKYLSKIFREAVSFSKKIRTAFQISEVPTSLPSTAVKYIMRKYPDDYQEKKVLLIGTGKMGRLTLRHLSAEGFKNVKLTNRTYHPGDEYKDFLNVNEVIEFKDRYAAIKEADIIITATASKHLIIKDTDLPESSHFKLFIDLALPKDIDRQIAFRENIELLTIDDFGKLIKEGKAYREESAREIKRMIPPAVSDLLTWIRQSRVDNIIAELNEQTNTQADETIEVLKERIEMSEKEKKVLSKIVHSKFREMVKPFLFRLKSLETEEEIALIQEAVKLLKQKEES